jgi:5-methylthioadenosine/S-adenosylhomocysteine deaminase
MAGTTTSLEFRHTPETLYASARLGIAEMIKSGGTTVIDMGTLHHQDSIFKAIEESGIRAQAGKAMMDFTDNLPPLLRETTADSVRESVDLMHHWHGKTNGRIHYGFAMSYLHIGIQQFFTNGSKRADDKNHKPYLSL